MNCLACSWHVAQGNCAAGCSAAGAAADGCVAGIGTGAGVGTGGWGGVAGGCCAAANPGDKPSASRRASPPRVNDRFDIGNPPLSSLRYAEGAIAAPSIEPSFTGRGLG